MSRLAIQISVAAAFLIIVVFSAEPNLNLKIPYGGDDYECQRFGGTVVVCVEKRTEPKANPKPTEPKANPKPTEPKANPKPTEPKANPKPTEPKANPKPTELKANPKPNPRCSKDNECESKICLEEVSVGLLRRKGIDCERKTEEDAKECEEICELDKKEDCIDCRKNSTTTNCKVSCEKDCTDFCRCASYVGICLDKASGKKPSNGKRDAIGQAYLSGCYNNTVIHDKKFPKNKTKQCQYCCGSYEVSPFFMWEGTVRDNFCLCKLLSLEDMTYSLYWPRAPPRYTGTLTTNGAYDLKICRQKNNPNICQPSNSTR